MRRDVEYEEDDNFDYLFKLVLIGDAGVGKSALVHRFKYNTYVDRQASTIGVDFIIRSVTVDGKKIKVIVYAIQQENPVCQRRESLSKQLGIIFSVFLKCS